VSKWLTHHLGRDALAPLTGQDARALRAFVHLVELYAQSDASGRREALVALRATVLTMQLSTRHLAKKSIPHLMDWSDEERLWSQLAGDDGTWRFW
jgi:hypothetical protein